MARDWDLRGVPNLTSFGVCGASLVLRPNILAKSFLLVVLAFRRLASQIPGPCFHLGFHHGNFTQNGRDVAARLQTRQLDFNSSLRITVAGPWRPPRGISVA
ncbi:hypothetical protein CC79DRAFT_1332552, partial [Sarocladium strictum]